MKHLATLLQRLSRASAHRRSPRGFSLLTVLLSLALLASILAGFASVVQNRTGRVAREFRAASAARAAEAGVSIAVASLLGHAALPELVAKRTAINGRPFSCRLNTGTTLVISMQDIAGRLDLNTAEAELLTALFASTATPDIATSHVSAIMRRRRDNEFRMTEELAQLPGMERTLYQQVRRDLTVYSRRASLNATSARPELRTLMARAGVSEDDAFSASADGRVFAVSVLARAGPGRGYLLETTVEIRPDRMPAYHALSWHGHIARSASLPSPYAAWMTNHDVKDTPNCTTAQ